MSSLVPIAIIVIAVFAWEIGRMWWRQNAWRRRWRNKDAEEDA